MNHQIMSSEVLVSISRLPLLFVIDSILQGTFLDFRDLPFLRKTHGVSFRPLKESMSDSGSWDAEWFTDLVLTHAWRLSLGAVLGTAYILLVCPVKILQGVYHCLLSFGCLVLSQKLNEFLLQSHKTLEDEFELIEEDSDSSYFSYISTTPWLGIYAYLFVNAIVALVLYRICVTKVLKTIQDLTHGTVRVKDYPIPFLLYICLSCPMLADTVSGNPGGWVWQAMHGAGLAVLHLLVMAGAAVTSLQLAKVLVPAVMEAKAQAFEIGIDGLLLRLFELAHLKTLLRLFFVARLSWQLAKSEVLREFPWPGEEGELTEAELLTARDPRDPVMVWLGRLGLELLIGLVSTLPGIMAAAAAVSTALGLALKGVYRLVGVEDEDASMQPAVSGFLFVLLALQTGVTEAPGPVRPRLVAQNTLLLLVANQHFLQGLTADLLLKASTQPLSSWRPHLRPLAAYPVFLGFAGLVVPRLWGLGFRTSWLLAVSCFSLELCLRCVTTLTLYVMNMLHTHSGMLTDSLEDVTFVVRACGGTADFCCGVFLFLNGGYIFFFESGGLIRLIMMMVHLYCNIYSAAGRGIKALRLRWAAQARISALRPASAAELTAHADVCSICYQDMDAAVILPCGHFFHRQCLRQWLTIQEVCPLCHTPLSLNTKKEKEGNMAAGEPEEPGQPRQPAGEPGEGERGEAAGDWEPAVADRHAFGVNRMPGVRGYDPGGGDHLD